ncbi:TPA: PD-(D/E)XK nuclease family protein [Campylobacter coli]|nr:PD-(D/E)XK nuclease family protein [Campylobacter coli]
MHKIILRPSGIASFYDCSYRWYRDTIYKPIRRVGIAAHIGTGIHKASEIYYKESIKNKDWAKYTKDLNSLAIDEFRKIVKEDEPIDIKEVDLNSLEKSIDEGTTCYLSSASKINKDIPIDVEKTYEVKVKSNIIESVKGTLDIVGNNYIADIKTMRQFKNAKHYVVQQSIYAFLRSKNKEVVEDLYIHRVNMSKYKSDCVSILQEYDNPCINIDILINKAKFYLEDVVKTCEDFFKTGNERLFRGNPNSILCSAKYCAYYNECKYRKE